MYYLERLKKCIPFVTLLLTIQLLIPSIEANSRTDITDCQEIEFSHSTLHPALNGIYRRTIETYNGFPVFSGAVHGKTRFVWWQTFDKFSRWSVGTVKFSNSIEGFIDNKKTDAWILGQGRGWRVVHQGQWITDGDLYVNCRVNTDEMGMLSPDTPVTNGIDDDSMDSTSAEGPPDQAPPVPQQHFRDIHEELHAEHNMDNRGAPIDINGATPPGVSTESAADSLSALAPGSTYLRIGGSLNEILNGDYIAGKQPYDNFDVYRNHDSNLHIFHYSYATFKRWYIGRDVGYDGNVMAFLDDRRSDIALDSTEQSWTEHDISGEWETNRNLDLKLITVPDIQLRPQSNGGTPPGVSSGNVRDNNAKYYDADDDDDYDDSNESTEKGKKSDESRSKRRRDMFRRVNKLDQTVQEEGTYESGVNVRKIPNVVVVGSDSEEINHLFVVQNVKYNDHNVFKSAPGNYLYFVQYEQGNAARWQIGVPGGGMQNDQPIAFVNSDSEKPEDIPTWQAWLVFDETTNEWLRQSRVNTYKADCEIKVAGAWDPLINGNYSITPETYEHRPVFEKVDSGSGERYRMIMFMDDSDGTYSRWYISKPDGEVGKTDDTTALIQSGALTPDGITDFENWQEYNAKKKDYEENEELSIVGNCAKVREHDWRRRRRKRKEERQKRKALEANAAKHCPDDITVSTDRRQSYAIVHWTPFDSSVGENDDSFDVIYDEGSLAPGSQFPIGRTAVTYSITSEGNEIAKCDFIVKVVDEEAPQIECPGDIYIPTQFNTDTATISWEDPDVRDNSDSDVELTQISGPNPDSIQKVGVYKVTYTAKDGFGNANFCNFKVVVQDRQAPTIRKCAQDTRIEVYSDQDWSAWPEWDIPEAYDAVDGIVDTNLVVGSKSGSKLTLNDGEDEYKYQVTYESVDKAGNAARCIFFVTLVRNSEGGSHDANHDRLELGPEIDDEELKRIEEADLMHHQPEEWTRKARGLREDKQSKRKRRNAKRKRNKFGGHRSKIHDSARKSSEQEAKDEMRDATDEIEEETTAKSKRKSSRRNKRNSNRRNRRKVSVNTADDDEEFGLSFFGAIWVVMTPWNWPWPCLIPFMIICCVFCSIGCYFLVEDLRTPKGRRVPAYNSFMYKFSSWRKHGRKTMKQRV